MTELNPVGRPATPPASGEPTSHRARDSASAASGRQPDTVELSSQARQASQASQADRGEGIEAIRMDVVARVRAEIAAGTYETPQKIEALLDKLLEDLQ